MKNYLVLYTPGMCGTWLSWLINQHKNFPHYKLEHKNYINDLGETKSLDVGCFGADFYTYAHMAEAYQGEWATYHKQEAESIRMYRKVIGERNKKLDLKKLDNDLTTWSFKDNRHVCPSDGEIKNQLFKKDCVKVLPNHGIFTATPEIANSFQKIDKELLKIIIDDMQPEKIIVPIFNTLDETLIKRWIIYLLYHNKSLRNQEKIVYWQKIWNEWSDYVIQDNPYGNNVHYVDIEKLTSGDNDEYLKLCEAIDEPPIDKIQEEITSYRNIILEVGADFDRNYMF